MNVTVNSKDFTEAITRVVQALEQPAALPVLAGILLDAERGELHIWGGSSGLGGYANVRVQGAIPGLALPHGQTLARISRHLPGDTVTLDVQGPKIKITSGPASWTLMLMPVEDYPGWLAEVVKRDGNYADQAKPQQPGNWEQRLTRTERFIKTVTTPWKATRARALYEPPEFAAGDWVTITTGTETLLGQMAASDLVIWMRDGRNEVQQVFPAEKAKKNKGWYVVRESQDWTLRRVAGPNVEHFEPPTSETKPAGPRKSLAAPDQDYQALPDIYQWDWPQDRHTPAAHARKPSPSPN